MQGVGRPFSGVCGPAASQWTVVASTESTTPTASEQGGTLPLYSRRERGLEERTGIFASFGICSDPRGG